MCWKMNRESQESYWWSESRHPPDKLVKKMISLTNIIKTDNKERLRPLRKWKDPKKHRLYQLLWVLIEDRLSRKMVLETVENEKNEIICDQENIACKKGEDINTFQRWKTTSMPWFRLIQKSGIYFLARVSKWAISFQMEMFLSEICLVKSHLVFHFLAFNRLDIFLICKTSPKSILTWVCSQQILMWFG